MFRTLVQNLYKFWTLKTFLGRTKTILGDSCFVTAIWPTFSLFIWSSWLIVNRPLIIPTFSTTQFVSRFDVTQSVCLLSVSSSRVNNVLYIVLKWRIDKMLVVDSGMWKASTLMPSSKRKKNDFFSNKEGFFSCRLNILTGYVFEYNEKLNTVHKVMRSAKIQWYSHCFGRLLCTKLRFWTSCHSWILLESHPNDFLIDHRRIRCSGRSTENRSCGGCLNWEDHN